VVVRARESQLAPTVPTVTRHPHHHWSFDFPEATVHMPTSMLGLYQVRLRRSRRLPYRIARLLLLALPLGLLLVAYIARH